MAYQIKCDDYVLYDHRDDELIVLTPKCKLEANTVGEASFTIQSDHPYYGTLKKLKSIFEIRQDNDTIFRGRMTADSRDFQNQYFVDLEGILAVTNDSIISPFNFPGDFPEAANATNMVEYFLGWLLARHNEQVTGEWQKLKLGTVTVSDPNNYITRSSDKYLHTWEILKSKLFDSELGGYLCPRYEADGTYVDYLSTFPLTNTQPIKLGENLLDIKNESDASETYSVILPIGKDGLTLESLLDGDLTDDLVKKGKFIYSKSAVATYGWICVPVNDSTWDDVTEVANLKTKGMNYLTGTGMLLANTITVKAVNLHFSDDEIQSFRIYRNILVDSPAHGVSGVSYPLTKLDIDLMNPQNTTITVGAASRSLIDINADRENNVDTLIQSTKNELKDYVSSKTTQLEQQIAGLDGLYFYIKYSQYADGHVMTDVPDDSTQYMGTCSTNSATAPTDYRKYTWCKVRGEKGTPGSKGDDGKTQYLHIKYSDDGKTFTNNNGEDLGAWIGTLVDFTEADSTNFNDYAWKKFTEDVHVGGRNLIRNSKNMIFDDYHFLYEDLDYIETTGEQYIDTGFFLNQDSRIVTTFQLTASVTGQNLYGARYRVVDRDFSARTQNSRWQAQYGEEYGTVSQEEFPHKYPSDNEIHVIDHGASFYLDGEFIKTYEPATFSTPNTCTIGAINASNGLLYCKSRFYDFTIYDKTTLAHDLVPRKSFDGIIGMYDAVNDMMHGNAGTGEFVVGDPTGLSAVEPATVTSPYGKEEECSKFTLGGAQNFYVLSNITTPGNKYTLSFWAKSDSVGTITVCDEEFATSAEWQKITFSYDADGENLIFGFKTGTYYICNPKLEIGDVATEWTPAPEDIDAAIDSSSSYLQRVMLEQNTQMLNTAEQIILGALERYVETSNYDEFRQTVESQLVVLAEQITMNFTGTTERITDVNGDLQAVTEKLEKHFEFSLDGVIIKAGEHSMNLLLDNDLIRFMKNGQQFGWWDGVDFHTGNIVVEVNERAQFGNFAFVPRSNGSLSFLKVGD